MNSPFLVFNEKKDLDSKFYSLPVDLTAYIFQQLSGKNGNAIKLIIVLLGTHPNFRLTQSWVLKHTGLTKDGYYKARQTLIDKGMLIVDTKKNQLIVNIDGMLEQCLVQKYLEKATQEEINQLLLQEA